MRSNLTPAIVTIFTIFLFSGCVTSSPKTPQELHSYSVVEFFDDIGLSKDADKGYFVHHATKSTKLDATGEWTMKYKEYFKTQFQNYCVSQGGKVMDSDAFIAKLYPITKHSTKARVLVSSKLGQFIKGYKVASKLCVVDDRAIFGYNFSLKHKDYTGKGVIREQIDKDALSVSPVLQYAYNNMQKNSWYNIDTYAVVINKSDWIEANMFVVSALSHFELEKKATPSKKEYPKSKSGFRRF